MERQALVKHKSAVVGFAYLSGLICGFLLELNPGHGFIGAVSAVAAGLALLIIKKIRPPDLGLFITVFGVAFGIHAFYQLTALSPIYALDGETREVVGVVRDKTTPARDMAGYVIEADIDGVKTRFSFYGLDVGAEVGDGIAFKAKFALLRDNTAFAESSYYMGKGVFLKASAVSTPVAIKNDALSPAKLIREYNSYLKRKITTAFRGDTGALILAVFLGDKSALSDNLSRMITRTGISHYAAVSGLHLTIMAHFIISLLGLIFPRFNSMRKFRFIFIALLILVFMVFFNLSPSVLRAGVMLIVFYGGELFMRRGSTLNSVGFAALILVIVLLSVDELSQVQ